LEVDRSTRIWCPSDTDTDTDTTYAIAAAAPISTIVI
jgi:hypothetical protein